MDLLNVLSNPLDVIHSLVVGFAIFLFLICYITLNIIHARKVTMEQPTRLPVWLVWLTPVYSTWFDKLTLLNMVKAFVQALGIAFVSWIVLMIFLVIVAAKGS